MSNIFLVVIADPAAPFLAPLAALRKDIRVVVTEDLEQLKSVIPQADAILYASFSPVLARILPLAHRVRWIHVLWTGVDGVLTPEMMGHPAVLTNGRGVFKGPLADWVVAVMLYFAFDFRRLILQQEQRVWAPFISDTLKGRVLGIIGYGSIGSAVAARARLFGMKIIASRRRPELFQSDPLVDQGYGPGHLKELMAASDYVLLVTPLTAQTRGMVGEAEIGSMKPAGVLMNIARGPVVDESALIRALEAKRIRGAALDVFNTEPLPPEHPFWQMSNVLLSPHTADRVDGFLSPAFESFFENLDRFIQGQALQHVVDRNSGY
jgi:phosphoglycerate dehydrogenase-like enzyme